MVERSLVFIKPDGVERGLIGDILGRFERRGLCIKRLEMMSLRGEQIDRHYEEHLEKPFYPELKAYISSGPIVVMVLEGESAVSVIRQMVGATNAAEAMSGTIRGDFALTTSKNIVHASDSVENAEREINNFF